MLLRMVYPPIEPHSSGLLAVTDGNEIYWETAGNPDGVPVLYLHGGPGGGLGAGGYRRRCDPDRHLIIGIDQRGCGRSRPLAIDALERIETNTSQAMITDIEAVREQLSIDSFLVTGVSWGTTLALAYALHHPERVSGLVLLAVTTTSRAEVDWITEEVGRIFPEAWDTFRRASRRRPDERVVEAYARRLISGDAQDRSYAARAWNDWENVHISLGGRRNREPEKSDELHGQNFAILVSHYWANDAFLPDRQAILNRVDEIGHIPAVLIHGRQDVSGPAITPWKLHQQWPASELIIVEDEGHGGETMINTMVDATDRLTRLS